MGAANEKCRNIILRTVCVGGLDFEKVCCIHGLSVKAGFGHNTSEFIACFADERATVDSFVHARGLADEGD